MPLGYTACGFLIICFLIEGLVSRSENPDQGNLSPSSRDKKQVVSPVSVAPTGWRKTESGWELSDNWPVAAGTDSHNRINQLIENQKKVENSSWIGTIGTKTIQTIQQMDPITLVALQVTAIALLLVVAKQSQPKTDESTLAE
jgi:hypothetical protein